ncbi:MAG TPA: hypothetical protein VMT64_14955 [Candidatus Binataceae bacterium]|nr:hypothetical protein [Candidatus Binataceae bacterium]
MIFVLMLLPASNGFARAPLAIGGAPPCSKQNGTREFHSAVVEAGHASARLVGIARRDGSECRRSAELRIVNADGSGSSRLLPSDADDFEIVDFSPDGSQLLLADEGAEIVHIAMMPLAGGDAHWQDISDLLGWKDCEATVEPRGFTADGKVVVLARPSVMSEPKRPTCVAESTLFAFDAHWKATQLDEAAGDIPRFGKRIRTATQACKTDPDLTDACFALRGRLRIWNGNPTFRIWPVGSKRELGVTDRLFPADEIVLPESLDGKLSDEVDAFADFTVCPFTPEVSGSMQMVCIDAADNVSFRPR